MIFNQIFDMVDVGLVILDKKLRVRYWNRWMASHSGISTEEIIESSIFDYYPHLKNKKFLRNCKAVLTFGSFYFFSQKLYDYIFPFKPDNTFDSQVKFMQQSCTMGPLRDGYNSIEYVYISVKDVTEAYIYEKKLTEALFSLINPEGIKDKVPDSVLTELYTASVDKAYTKQTSPSSGKQVESKSVHGQIEELITIIGEAEKPENNK